MDRKWMILVAVIAMLLLFQFRYEIVSTNHYAYRLDRWTGKIAFIIPNQGKGKLDVLESH